MRHKQYFIVFFLVIATFFVLTNLSYASTYGSGGYGVCQYQADCSISVSTGGTVDIGLSPTGSGVYSIDNDEVSVSTNSPDGYTLSLEMSSPTSNNLHHTDSGVIPATGGSPVIPAYLSMNSWGFRVDEWSGFGVGPTTRMSNLPTSSLLFAEVPLAGGAVKISETNTAALTPDITKVWFGIRADSSQKSGIYTGTVTYSVVAL